MTWMRPTDDAVGWAHREEPYHRRQYSHGARQGSRRLGHAANFELFDAFVTMPTTKSLSGFSLTTAMCVQLPLRRRALGGGCGIRTETVNDQAEFG